MHHAISDGWSLVIAVEEIYRLYEAFASGPTPALQELPVQYPEYAAWEREQLHSGRMTQQLSYWKRQLAGAPVVLEIPFDRPRPPVQSFRGAHLRLFFDGGLLARLKEVSRQEGVTLFMTLLGAWQVLLHRYSGQEEIMVGSPVANRSLPVFEGLIGCFVNNVVLRGDLRGNPTFREFLGRVKHTTLDAFEHCELPFDVLVDGVNPQRTASHAPLFQVFFTLLSFPTRTAPPAGLAAEMLESDTRASRFDLTIELLEQDGQLRALYEYATDLFDESTIDRLHAHFGTLLRAVAADPSRSVRDLPLLTPEDEHLLLERWNDTPVEHERSLCVHHLLEATARRQPAAVAVIGGEESLTYAQLERRANQLAHLLCRRGVRPVLWSAFAWIAP